MANEHSLSTHPDIDQTDRLAILNEAQFDIDVEDDAAPMDATEVLPDQTLLSIADTQPNFVRPPGVDLPSLAESVRSVEERITRQNADYEALTRAYVRMQESEAASTARANAL